MWPGGPSRGSINYGLPHDMGMVGLRDVFVMAGPHHHPHHGVGVIPLLTAAPCLPIDDDSAAANNSNPLSNRASRNGLQPWQQNNNNSNQPPPSGVIHHHHHHQSQQPHFFKKPPGCITGFEQESSNFAASIGASIGTGSGTATCQDCGNQAKKDCTHRRCRTCCKSRGFDCATHVKSTWVPAARRRERQLITPGCGGGGGPVSSGSTSGAKKPRLIASQTTTTSHTSTSNTTPPRSFDTSSSHQDAGFKETLPGQVRAPAVFKCVRVTAVEDGEDEYAYQAVVKIGGHVFKGFLYDQGLENNSREPIPNISELHLGGGGGRNNAGGGSTSPIIDPADVYGSSGGGGFLQGGGSRYGNPIN